MAQNILIRFRLKKSLSTEEFVTGKIEFNIGIFNNVSTLGKISHEQHIKTSSWLVGAVFSVFHFIFHNSNSP